MAGGGVEQVSEARFVSEHVSNNTKASRSSRHVSKKNHATPQSPDLVDLRAKRAHYYATPERRGSTTYGNKLDPGTRLATGSRRRGSQDHTVRGSATDKRRDSVQGHVYSLPNHSGRTYSHESLDERRVSHRSGNRAVLSPVNAPYRTRESRVVDTTRDSSKHERPGSNTPLRHRSHRKSADPPLHRSLTTPTRRPAPAVRLVECLICASDDVPVHNSAKLECGHRMCHDCLRRIFKLSTTDPAHMPPKCCTSRHIPLKHVDGLFDDRFKHLWNRKYQEYKTSNRLYCPSKRCGEWIKPSHIHTDRRHPDRKYGECKRCKTRVCASCNNNYHKRRECPNDPATAAFIATAKERGWQSCYSCRAVVELKEGCNHMTCRCTAEFCMLCGSKWKTCECPWFNHAGIADGDRLNDMRIPHEPVAIPIRRRTVDAGGGGRPQRTYVEELEARRRQEREDEEMARRMQFDPLHDGGAGLPIRPAPHQAGRDGAWPRLDVFGFGAGVGHFMNDNFVRNLIGADPRLSFDDRAAGYGRRGERESARHTPTAGEQSGYGRADEGLPPNAFGDASVLGSAGVAGLRSNGSQGKKKRASFLRIAKNGGAAQGGKTDRIRGWLTNVE